MGEEDKKNNPDKKNADKKDVTKKPLEQTLESDKEIKNTGDDLKTGKGDADAASG